MRGAGLAIRDWRFGISDEGLAALLEPGVTFYSGRMGDTLPPRRGHALEGVSRHGRAAAIRRALAGRRADDDALYGVRHLPEDGLQDLRPLQGVWPPRPQ